MVLSSVLATLSLLVGAFAAPGYVIPTAETKAIGARATNFWSSWSEGSGSWRCANGAGGSYTVTWSGTNGGFVCGKGWSPGGSRLAQSTRYGWYPWEWQHEQPN
jgi:endo-1,4-beta-xylanase